MDTASPHHGVSPSRVRARSGTVMGRIVWRWTDGELARWEAALRAAPASAVEVEEVLALLAEVRRLRGVLIAIREEVEAGRADWVALHLDHGLQESPLLARIAEALA